MSKVELTDQDRVFEHIIFSHLLTAYKEIIIAVTEAATGPEDPRFEEMVYELDEILRTFDKFINDQIDKVPDTLSLEEAQEKVDKLFEQAALLDGLPADTYLPPKQTFH